MNINQRIEKILNHLSDNMYEREHIIALTLLGALSGTNTFLLGSPGTAKSLISRKIAQAFEQPKYFEYLMNRFSTPEEVFGPVSIKALKEDRYTRKIESYLPNADFAFLDEIWKSSPAILNALLTLVNEKLFKNGDEILHVPLKALISASNEIPAENQGLDALYDRFILRLIVEPIKNNENFLNLIGSKPTEIKVNLDKQLLIKQDEWQKWQKDIHEVKFSKEVSDIILMIRQMISDLPKDKKIYVSDRRWQRAAYLLKAAAFFNGRQEVILSEIFLLKYCLWSKSENFKDIDNIVEQCLKNNGLDSGIDQENSISEKQRLENEIKTELYYSDDVYDTVQIGTEEYYPFTLQTYRNEIEVYINVSHVGTDEWFYAKDINGNDLNYEYNFQNNGSCNFHNMNKKFTPQVKYTKGSKKEDINKRLIKALHDEVGSIQKNFEQALLQVTNRKNELLDEFDSLFISLKEKDFLVSSLEKQIQNFELNIQDSERLKSLCIS